jgi:hypothetical protein
MEKKKNYNYFKSLLDVNSSQRFRKLIFRNALFARIQESLSADEITGKYIQEEDNTIVLSLLLIISLSRTTGNHACSLRNLIIRFVYDL